MKKIMIGALIICGAGVWWGMREMPDARKKGLAGNASALGMVRGALQVYYGENEGKFPADALQSVSSGGKYPDKMPELWGSPEEKYPHPPTSGVVTYQTMTIADSGKFAYINNPADPAWGTVYIDCSHSRENGTFWSDL